MSRKALMFHQLLRQQGTHSKVLINRDYKTIAILTCLFASPPNPYEGVIKRAVGHMAHNLTSVAKDWSGQII